MGRYDDDLPLNPLQHIDQDGDGVGDTISSSDFDMCVETPVEELAMVDSTGCGPQSEMVIMTPLQMMSINVHPHLY